MKTKVLFPVVLFVLVLLLMPTVLFAGMNAPYTSYSGAAYGEDYDGDDESRNERGRSSYHYSPELPVYSDTWIGNPDQYAEANSSMNLGEGPGPVGVNAEASSSMNLGGDPVSVYLHAYADNALAAPTYSEANAEAIYNEYFTAAAPVYQLAYDYSYDLFVEGFSSDASATNAVYGYFEIYDMSWNLIYENNFIDTFVQVNGIDTDSDSGGGSGVLNADLIVGNDYYVWMDIYEYAHAQGDATAGQQNDSLYLNYSVNVVPEPISYALFIVGAATLGFRRFRKQASL